jgi:hypothetical protein
MPMPSLFKYFAFVGVALLALITLANFLLDPSNGATAVATTTKPAIVVQHDPRASKIERWRNEQAALKAAAQTPAGENASLVTKSELAPPSVQQVGVTAPAQPAAPQPTPAQMQPAEPAMQTADVSAEHDAEAARAAELARIQSEKAKAAKARKAKIARERAKADQLAREGAQGQWQQGQWGQWQQGQNQNQLFSSAGQRTASNQQDQFYYGQRQSSAQPPAGNAYAQRPAFGPFGGWGRGW